MTTKDEIKKRKKSLILASIDKKKIKKQLEPISEKEKLNMVINNLKSLIHRIEIDLQNPDFMNNNIIKYKLQVMKEQLKEKEEQLKQL